MHYTFHLTTTESKVYSNTIELKEEMTINELKLLLIGPIINSIGYDKIKFFQTGRQFSEDNLVGEFNESERILVFPMIPSLRTILIKCFSNDEDSEDELEKTQEQYDCNQDETQQQIYKEKLEQETISQIDEKPPKMEFKSLDDIVTSNTETLKMFQDENMQKLLDIYFNDTDKFIEFINYLSKGQYNEFEEDVSIKYPDGMFDSIRNTFPFLQLSNEELRIKLDKVGGNLDLLICQNINS